MAAPTKIQGDPSHPVTRGFLCAKVTKYLDRVYSPDRVLYPMRRVAAKGTGHRNGQDFIRISWDEALDEIASRFKNISAEHGPEAILPYSYGGTLGVLNGGSMDRRFFQSHRRFAARASDLFGSRRSWTEVRDRRQMGTEPEQFRVSRYNHRLGEQYPRQQRSPVAVHHRGPAPGREARGHRSLPHPHGSRWRLVSPYQSRHRRCAGARHDARHHQRESLRRRLRFAPHVGLRCLRTKVQEYPPERAAQWTGISADDIRKLAREYATTRPAVIR